MGLYLCIFDGDEDVDGVEVGPYADFNALRDYITRELEGGRAGTRFPVLMLHSDSDGEWSLSECETLRDELAEIATEPRKRPAVEYVSDWQQVVARSVGLVPQNALESFIDVDGEFLIERLQSLVASARGRGLPILFQ